VILMSLMGFIRSGLREDWHIFGVLRDTSEGAFTPSMAVMARVIAGIVTAFVALVGFVFWLAGLGEQEGEKPPLVRPELASASGQD
jgi:hypothetical protein